MFIPLLIVHLHQKHPLLYIVCNTRYVIVILYLILGIQPSPTTDITMISKRITIIAVVGGVLGLVLITGILLCVLCIMYFKKRWYTYKLKGTLSIFDRILVVINNVLTLHHNHIYYTLITYISSILMYILLT